MKKSILVTGAGGFIGATIIRKALKDGYAVHAVLRSGSNTWRIDGLKKQLFQHVGVLEDAIRLRILLHKIQPYAIYHLATYGSIPKQTDQDRTVTTNIIYLHHLLEASKDIPYIRFILSGSSSEYGKKSIAMRESDTCEPNNLYASSKCAATIMALAHARIYKKPVTVLRLFNVYGPYEEEGRLVRSVISSVLSKRPIALATGKEARDFIHVDDVANAFLHITKKHTSWDGDVFNIGTGVETTIKQLAQNVITAAGYSVPIECGVYEGRVWDSVHWKADMKKTHSILKWHTTIPLAAGLKKTIEWYKKQGAENQ